MVYKILKLDSNVLLPFYYSENADCIECLHIGRVKICGKQPYKSITSPGGAAQLNHIMCSPCVIVLGVVASSDPQLYSNDVTVQCKCEMV